MDVQVARRISLRPSYSLWDRDIEARYCSVFQNSPIMENQRERQRITRWKARCIGIKGVSLARTYETSMGLGVWVWFWRIRG